MVDFNTEYMGLGFTDATEIEEREYEWLIKGILPKGFGFITGLPKNNHSPYGGKSVFSRLLALSILTGKPLFGEYEVQNRGNVMIINLDELQTDIKRSLLDLSGGELIEGIKVCNRSHLNLFDDMYKLESDIELYSPKIVFIDPLFRTLGGKDINSNTTSGPVIDGLKRLHRKYGVTIVIVHHCTKTKNSDLLGTIDLESSWDFRFTLEYSKNNKRNEIKCKYKFTTPEKSLFYRSDSQGEGIGRLELVETNTDSGKDDLILKELKKADFTVNILNHKTKIPISTLKRRLKNLEGSGVVSRTSQKGNSDVWSLKK